MLIRQAFKAGLWESSHPLQATRTGRVMLRLMRVTAFAAKRFWDDECLVRATALAYSTMLAIVPLLAVAFSLFAAFPDLRGAYNELRAVIYQSLAPGTSEPVVQALDSFVQNIRSGAVAGFGTAGLFISVLLLLSSIDSAFDRIFEVTKSRRMVERIVYYLAFTVVGPVLIGLSLRTFFGAFVREFTRLGFSEANPLAIVWEFLVPLGATVAVFTAMFVLIPNAKVRWSAGLAGGLIAGFMFELAKRGYTWYATNTVSYSAIYGAAGAIAIFIIWIYVVWSVVLLGAEFAYAWQNVDAHHRRMTHRDVGQSFHEWLATVISVEATRAFYAGEAGPTIETLHASFDVPDDMTQRILQRLTSGAILIESERGYLPARNPEHIVVADIVGLLRGGFLPDKEEASFLRNGAPGVMGALARLEQGAYAEYRKVTLADLARADDAAAAKGHGKPGPK